MFSNSTIKKTLQAIGFEYDRDALDDNIWRRGNASCKVDFYPNHVICCVDKSGIKHTFTLDRPFLNDFVISDMLLKIINGPSVYAALAEGGMLFTKTDSDNSGNPVYQCRMSDIAKPFKMAVDEDEDFVTFCGHNYSAGGSGSLPETFWKDVRTSCASILLDEVMRYMVKKNRLSDCPLEYTNIKYGNQGINDLVIEIKNNKQKLVVRDTTLSKPYTLQLSIIPANCGSAKTQMYFNNVMPSDIEGILHNVMPFLL